MAGTTQLSIPIQYDWQQLTVSDIKRPEILQTSFKIPCNFDATATKARNRLGCELSRCDNLIQLANLIIPCAKLQYLHNRFSANGHKCEGVYDNDTNNKMIVLLHDIVSYDLEKHPIRYMDIQLYQGPMLHLGEGGSARADNKKDTFYIVNDQSRTVPVYNGDVDPKITQSIQVLDYIMYNTLREIYRTTPQDHVDGVIFQNICRDSFNYPEMANIFKDRKKYMAAKRASLTRNDLTNLMDWHLSQINKNLSIGVQLIARTGGR